MRCIKWYTRRLLYHAPEVSISIKYQHSVRQLHAETDNYVLSVCSQIDECDLNCSTHAECRGAPGNYSCVCEPGFTGDGYNCTGKLPSNSKLQLQYIIVNSIHPSGHMSQVNGHKLMGFYMDF